MTAPNKEASVTTSTEHQPYESEDNEETASSKNMDMVGTVATVSVVAAGVVLMEAALLPGMILGVAAVAAPNVLPKVGSMFAPVFKSAVRGVYKMGRKTRELAVEAQEHVEDIVAEVNAEADANVNENKAA